MSVHLEPGGRICVVLLSGIGDVVHGLPVVNALKRDDPARHITWIVQSEAAPLLHPHHSIDRVITFDRRKGLLEVPRLWKKLRPLKFDLVINLNIYFKSAVPTFIARAPYKLGFGRDRAAELVWMFANRRLPARETRHVQDRFLEFLEYLGISPVPLEWRLQITGEEREAQRAFFAHFEGRPVVGIVATSGRASKDWPSERFAELTGALEREFGFKVILLGGPGLRERGRAQAIAGTSTADVQLTLGPDLRRLVYLIEGCDLLIAPDTGPVHIARALGTPVIGIYGHTDPTTIGPYRAYENLWIDRYNYDGPGQPTRDVATGGRAGRMELISVEDVLEKVELARRLGSGEER